MRMLLIAERLLQSAATLLTLLTNPLNVALLTTQLLSAPAIWRRPSGLTTSLRLLSLFNTASRQVFAAPHSSSFRDVAPERKALVNKDWLLAVIKGVDGKSPRWRHVCVLAGLRTGIGARNTLTVAESLHELLDNAFVVAVNNAMLESGLEDDLACNVVTLMLSHVFDFIDYRTKRKLQHDLLLPILFQSCFFSKNCLHSGYFLSVIDAGVVQRNGLTFEWSAQSSSFKQLQQLSRAPLFGNLGSISRVMAYTVEAMRTPGALAKTVSDLAVFSRCFHVQWRQNKLSEIDISEEHTFLSHETLTTSLPLLWQTLRSVMFALIVILSSVLSRAISDGRVTIENGGFLITP